MIKGPRKWSIPTNILTKITTKGLGVLTYKMKKDFVKKEKGKMPT